MFLIYIIMNIILKKFLNEDNLKWQRNERKILIIKIYFENNKSSYDKIILCL